MPSITFDEQNEVLLAGEARAARVTFAHAGPRPRRRETERMRPRHPAAIGRPSAAGGREMRTSAELFGVLPR